MGEMLEQLEPITKILGENGVKASFSGTELYDERSMTRVPGWRIEVNGSYRGAPITFTKRARSLDDAAAAAYRQLTEALGLD
jgi:hypothetical protein